MVSTDETDDGVNVPSMSGSFACSSRKMGERVLIICRMSNYRTATSTANTGFVVVERCIDKKSMTTAFQPHSPALRIELN